MAKDELVVDPKLNSSFVTIFSCANTMIGSGLVSLPWAFQQSGFILAVALCFVGFLIGFYTCLLIVK